MEGFIVRIVLHRVPHDLSHELYTKLHAAMEKAGFTRYLTNEGTYFQLPPAEYFHDLSAGAKAVWDKAVAAADSVDPNNGMVMTEGKIYYRKLKKWDAAKKTWVAS